jgi:hypothetical protein
MIPIFIAPFLSESTREFCRGERVGHLDFEGNTHIAFGPVYIERSTASRPKVESGSFAPCSSLAQPKSCVFFFRSQSGLGGFLISPRNLESALAELVPQEPQSCLAQTCHNVRCKPDLIFDYKNSRNTPFLPAQA